MEEVKGCITCAYIMKKCSGDCDRCGRVLDRGLEESGCKCIECYDEKTGEFRYYEPSEELLSLIGR
ncbi:MAG: hypothetical protein IJD91_01190 [Clostridia bacterium]|nr:hypothetical protein [Clostridia bacterium]